MREQADRWAAFVLANMLWCLFALPVITIPAATAGLFAAMSPGTRSQPSKMFAAFFGMMRRVWLKATVIGLLDVLAAGLIVGNLSIFRVMATLDLIGFLARSVTLFVGLALLLINLYVWPLMAVADMPVRQLIETSALLVFAHPVRAIGVLIAASLPVAISLVLPRAVWLFVTFSTCALII